MEDHPHIEKDFFADVAFTGCQPWLRDSDGIVSAAVDIGPIFVYEYIKT